MSGTPRCEHLTQVMPGTTSGGVVRPPIFRDRDSNRDSNPRGERWLVWLPCCFEAKEIGWCDD